jgi:hypothetical protein
MKEKEAPSLGMKDKEAIFRGMNMGKKNKAIGKGRKEIKVHNGWGKGRKKGRMMI